MTRTQLVIALASFVGLAACVSSTKTIVGDASTSSYQAEIDECANQGDCIHLCTDVLKIAADNVIRSKILVKTQYDAKFACEIDASGPGYYDGGTVDDSIDWSGDSTCDEGCDDSSGDSGGGDSSGDSSGASSASDSSSDDGGGCGDSGGDSASSDDNSCSTGGNSTLPLAGLAAFVIATRRRRR